MTAVNDRCRKLCQQHSLDKDIQVLKKNDKNAQIKQVIMHQYQDLRRCTLIHL